MAYCKKTLFSLFLILNLFGAGSFSIMFEGARASSLPAIENNDADLNIPWILDRDFTEAGILAHARLFNGGVAVTRSGEIIYSISSHFAKNRRVYFKEYLLNSCSGNPILEGKAATKISCFYGNDSSRWQNDIPSFRQIDFGKVYDGIELKLRAYAKNVEKIFLVNPGADPKSIRIRLDGIDRVFLTDEGELELEGVNGSARFTKPVAYQDISGRKEYVEVAYNVYGHEYGFDLGDYDRDHVLIIDPLLASTYIGGSQREGGENNQGFDITIDKDGNIFVIGMTTSLDFPISGAYCDSLTGNYDIFISKFNNDLTVLLASTYIGGSGYEESWGITADTSGNIFATGITSSNNFPYVSGLSYDSTYAGSSDAFVIKLGNDLSALLGATYLGGTGVEQRNSMALDESGNVYIGGMTGSLNFPTTVGSYNESYNGGEFDFCVSKLNNDLTELLASTYLGGLNHELWPDIEVDLNGNVFIAGATGSYNYPFTSGVYDNEFNGSHSYSYWNLDVVITKFSNDLSALLASTCIGSPDYEGSQFLKLDASGNVYVSGHTLSSGYPVTPGTYDVEFSGDEYFITKLDNNLTGLIASTFSSPGSSSEASLWGIALDNQENVYTTGVVWEDGFMTTDNAYDRTYNGGPYDGIIMKLNPDLTTALYASYFGGSGDEIGASIVLDNNGVAYISGTTTSADLPIEGGVFGTYNGGTSDCFVAKFTFDQFTRITEGPQVNDGGCSHGAAWVDYDNDNFLDLFVCNWFYENSHVNFLYHNDGDGTFSKITDVIIANEGYSIAVAWADYDNDGDEDAVVGNPGYNSPSDRDYFYINNGDGSFSKVTGCPVVTDTGATQTVSFVDYDNDGLLDLYKSIHCFPPCGIALGPYLYRNENFEFVKQDNGDIGFSYHDAGRASWADYDNDGDLDIIMGRDELRNIIYVNSADGTFQADSVNGCSTPGRVGGSYAWGDYDNDGDYDLFESLYGTFTAGARCRIYENIGNGNFTEIIDTAILTNLGYWTNGSWADYDNDGNLDIFVTGQYFYEPSPNALYRNNGNGAFCRVTEGQIANDVEPSVGCVWGDYDNDGDLDLFVTNTNYSNNTLYRNNGNSNNWISISCTGSQSNRSAIGTRIKLKATINANEVWQIREINGQADYSHQSKRAHFGLGDAVIVDSVKIEWPSGMVDVYTDVSPNQFMTYTETVCGDADGNFNVNILDITYLISYLYKDGPAPQHMQAADPDGNGTTNILDITFLIAYLYKGGSKPLCH